ncbi:MAG: elongation factor P, partial [Candidatus Eisenbacteria bacterium]|nr:elongation factor P [Candidatus Eisenbacteria bacterium]
EYHFMDNEDYDQFTLPKEVLEDYLPYMLENMTMESLVREDDGSLVDIAFPPSVVLEVTEAHDAARGDSAGPVSKPVKVETGYELLVPPFIKQGEKIRIDTETGKYMERA